MCRIHTVAVTQHLVYTCEATGPLPVLCARTYPQKEDQNIFFLKENEDVHVEDADLQRSILSALLRAPECRCYIKLKFRWLARSPFGEIALYYTDNWIEVTMKASALTKRFFTILTNGKRLCLLRLCRFLMLCSSR